MANIRGRGGFTLVELLIAAVLGLVVLAGLYSFYIASLPIYNVQDQLMETQQNLRIALEFIVEDIQATGGAGIPSESAVGGTNSSTASDTLDLMIPDGSICPAISQPIKIGCYNGAAANLFLGSGCSPPDAAGSASCAEMDGKVALLVTSDGLNRRTVQITQVTTTNNKINFSPGLAPQFNSPGGLGADYTGGSLVLVRAVTYSVDLTDAAKPILRRNLNNGAGAQPIANFIEDMQVSLGYDRDSNGVLDEVGSALNDDEWVYNFSGESNSGEASTNLRAVGVVLIGRTRLQDFHFTGSRPAVLDRGAGANDGYRRRTRGTVVQIRNLGP